MSVTVAYFYLFVLFWETKKGREMNDDFLYIKLRKYYKWTSGKKIKNIAGYGTLMLINTISDDSSAAFIDF